MTGCNKSRVAVILISGLILLAQLLLSNSSIVSAHPWQSSPRERARPDKQSEADAGPVPVIWREPSDLESRDLFHGIGGKKGAPDLSDQFRLIRRDTSGHAEKIQVEDSRGRRWTVKFGEESRPETVASRIVWAVGYHTDQDYFVEQVNIEGRGRVRDVRFERDDDGFKKIDRWDWNNNPFLETRELDGLKVLMAFLNNFDLKTDNNKIVRPSGKRPGDPEIHIYYVNDLGATLGATGKWFGGIPLFGELPAGTKGSAEDFARQALVDRVQNGVVTFRMKRTRAQRAITGVKVENARWIGNLLGRLSDKQLWDAFRAGGFSKETIEVYVRALRARIIQLQMLE